MTKEDMIETIDLLIWRLWGMKYRWGGDDPVGGFDCSGGILEILRSIGLWSSRLDANAQHLYDHFSKPDYGKILPTLMVHDMGTLIFFGKSTANITHVAMVYKDEIMFEFGGGGSAVNSEADAIAKNAYGRLRPVFNRGDVQAFIRPLQLAL